MKMEKKVYLNVESGKFKNTIGVSLKRDGKEILAGWAGKNFAPSVMTCEENGFTSLQRKRGVFLIWEGNIPKLDFFPVPSLTLFARDHAGGFFAYAEKNGEDAVYYISEKLECWYLAKNIREFVQMTVFEPNWKEKITGEKIEIHETAEELADFGMVFGLYHPEEKLSARIYRDDTFEVFENIEKAKEKCTLHEDMWS